MPAPEWWIPPGAGGCRGRGLSVDSLVPRRNAFDPIRSRPAVKFVVDAMRRPGRSGHAAVPDRRQNQRPPPEPRRIHASTPSLTVVREKRRGAMAPAFERPVAAFDEAAASGSHARRQAAIHRHFAAAFPSPRPHPVQTTEHAPKAVAAASRATFRLRREDAAGDDRGPGGGPDIEARRRARTPPPRSAATEPSTSGVPRASPGSRQDASCLPGPLRPSFLPSKKSPARRNAPDGLLIFALRRTVRYGDNLARDPEMSKMSERRKRGARGHFPFYGVSHAHRPRDGRLVRRDRPARSPWRTGRRGILAGTAGPAPDRRRSVAAGYLPTAPSRNAPSRARPTMRRRFR